jgi:hypothetical protein
MKRIITYLLVLSIALASFACTAKPEPESFKPLQNELVSAVYPEKSIDGLPIRWIHSELIEALDGSSWVKKDALLDQGGVFTVQLNDQSGDIYRFYAPGNGKNEYFVRVTQASDDDHQAYVISQSAFEALLSTLEHYVETIKVFQYPFASLTSMDSPTKPLTNTYLLESLKRSLSPDLWIRVEEASQPESNKRYVLVDEHGDTYTFYEIASNAQTAYVTVKRADQTTMMFRVSSTLMSELSNLMTGAVDDIVDQYYRNLLQSFIPKQVYLGSASTYDDSKLMELSTQVSELFSLRTHQVSYYLTESTHLIDAQSEVILIAKNDAGDYLTFYALPESEFLSSSTNFITVSIGKHPLADPSNAVFGVWFGEVYRYVDALTHFPNGETKALDLAVEVNDSISFPAFDMEWEVRARSYSTTLNAAMVDFLKKLEALEWTQQTFEEFSAADNFGSAHSVIITASNGTRYILPYNSNLLIVDEDPLTPGALVYSTSYESLWALGNVEATLEYLAQLNSDYAFSNVKITQYTLRFEDLETGDETFVDYDFTEAQSSALSALINALHLTKKTYRMASWGWNLEALLSTSTNLTIGFRNTYPLVGEALYGVITIYDPDNNISGEYFISVEEYNAILELYLSYIK